MHAQVVQETHPRLREVRRSALESQKERKEPDGPPARRQVKLIKQHLVSCPAFILKITLGVRILMVDIDKSRERSIDHPTNSWVANRASLADHRPGVTQYPVYCKGSKKREAIQLFHVV